MQYSLVLLLLVALCAASLAEVPPKIAEAVARAKISAHKRAISARLEQLKAKNVEEETKKVADPHVNAFGYAVDVISPVSQSTFSCMKNYGYSVVLLRLYGPSNNGQVDNNGVNNAFYANKAGLGYEVFVTPSTSGVKAGGTQFNEAYNYAVQQGLKLSRVWLQVTSPVNWPSNTYTNTAFINAFISAASSARIQVGIYTNWYDWAQITGSSTSVSASALWYWNANGVGSYAESKRDFSDLYAFGPFRSALIKQFGISENICSTTVNANVYSSGFELSENSVDPAMAMKFMN